MNEIPKQLNTHGLLFDLAESLSGLVIREHQILQSELSQIGVLVEDAVREISNSFRELNTSLCQKNSVQVKNNDVKHLKQRDDLTKQVEAYASNMKRVLQFDDIVQQLAGHASDRIGQMQQLFTLLDQDVVIIKSRDDINSETIIQLKNMLDNIQKYRQLLEKENPVKQDSMSEGGIELF